MKTLIETERLVLREITFGDKEELFELHADPDVQKWTGEPVVESMEPELIIRQSCGHACTVPLAERHAP